jgi:hypothetical protein
MIIRPLGNSFLKPGPWPLKQTLLVGFKKLLVCFNELSREKIGAS